MSNFQKSLLATCAIAVLCMSSVASAAGVRVRGEVTSFEGGIVAVKNAADQTTQVHLDESYAVLLYRDINIDSIPANAYVGVPSIPSHDGNLRALGVLVFPESMRGFNEGSFDWDITQDSKMSNGTVARFVSQAGERVLRLKFAEEEQTVFVPEMTQVATFAPDPERKIKLGDKVVIFAEKAGERLTAKYVGLHENGSLPPL